MSIKKLVTLSLAAGLVLPLTGCLRVPVARKKPPETIITLTEYQQIKQGMSYLDVVRVVGAHGHHAGSAYSWTNPDMTGAIVWFERNRSIRKGKVGDLK